MIDRVSANLAFQNGYSALADNSTSSKGPNIGILIPQFPGQTHIFFWREIAALEGLGASVNLLSTRLPPKGLISHDWSDGAIARTTYLGRIRPLKILFALASLPWSTLMVDIKRNGITLLKDILICAGPARELATICQRQKITHVHVHSCGRAALIATLANRMSGLSYSLTLHGAMADYGNGQGLKWRHAAFATIITQKLLAEARTELGPDMPARVEVQPMGVETDFLKRTQPYQPPKPNQPIELFACGRLNLFKGHQDLLQAVRLLVDHGFDIRLNIAGEDDLGGDGYRQVLEEKIDTLGLKDRVTLLGAISAEAVKEHLLKAHIFVLASWQEALGVAYMEAMSCAVPTVGTKAGGVTELIEHGQDGLLALPKNPDNLAETIRALIENPTLCQKLSVAGREKVIENFGSDKGAKVILDQISQLPGN